jgi:hypothetical protein
MPGSDKTVEATVVATAQPVHATVVVSAEPVPNQMQRYEDPNIAIGEWDKGLCGCCSHKECGLMCCINFCFCSPCIYASNVSQSGLTPFGVDNPDTLCWATLGITFCTTYCCGPQLWNYGMRREHVQKYGMKESDLESGCMACCCNGCSMLQLTNEIMVRKNLTFECGQVKPDLNSGAALNSNTAPVNAAGVGVVVSNVK